MAKINIQVLPGEPLDGTGRVATHLFVHDEWGKFVEPHVLHPVFEDGKQIKQQVEVRPTHGRLACDPNRNPAPITRGRVIINTSRTDDPRAVTCYKCIATEDYKRAMLRIEEAQQCQSQG